jgi:hypothetical protein
MDVVTNTIYAGEALFAYLNLMQRLAEQLRAIRRIDRSTENGSVRPCQKSFLKRHRVNNDDFPGLLPTVGSISTARNRAGRPFGAY